MNSRAESQEASDIADAPPFIVISRYGHKVIEWHKDMLEAILTQLQRERQSCGQPQDITDAGTAKLIARAEHIKDNATKYIITTDAPS
jgi:hypothetical protein